MPIVSDVAGTPEIWGSAGGAVGGVGGVGVIGAGGEGFPTLEPGFTVMANGASHASDLPLLTEMVIFEYVPTFAVCVGPESSPVEALKLAQFGFPDIEKVSCSRSEPRSRSRFSPAAHGRNL